MPTNGPRANTGNADRWLAARTSVEPTVGRLLFTATINPCALRAIADQRSAAQTSVMPTIGWLREHR